jgi:hypothetical protein
MNVSEDKIVEFGITDVNSIFLFQEKPTDMAAFLHMAQKKHSHVYFENEDIMFACNDNGWESESMLLNLITYLTMNKKYGDKYIDWVQGQHEAVLG